MLLIKPFLILFVIFAIIFLIESYKEQKSLTLAKFHMDSDKAAGNLLPVRIAILSDLHDNHYGKNNEKLLELIQQQQPDIILIAGDMIIGKKDFKSDRVLKLLKILADKYPVYYANGNHELKLSIYPETKDTTYLSYTDAMKSYGIKHLVNQMADVPDSNIRITGLEIGAEFYKKLNRPRLDINYIESKLGKADKNKFNILIAHNPMYLEQYAEWGADVVVSGHVHGGIIRIPYIGGVISPQYILFPKYDAGIFKEKDTTMFLSRGLGTHTLKFRLFNKPEIILLYLKQLKQKAQYGKLIK